MADEKAPEKIIRIATKSGTVVAPCAGTCRPHDFQDKQYRGMRLHNYCAKGTKRRCTVCGHETGV